MESKFNKVYKNAIITEDTLFHDDKGIYGKDVILRIDADKDGGYLELIIDGKVEHKVYVDKN